MNSIRPPDKKSQTSHAPRPKPKETPFYVFTQSQTLDYKEVVSSVMNGLEASSISPELYPTIYPMLNSTLPTLNKNNPAAAQSVENALDFILSYRPHEDRPKPVLRDEFIPTKPMIDEAISSVLSHKNLKTLNPQILPYLIKPLHQIYHDSIDNCEYFKAQNVQNAMHEVINFMESRDLQIKQENHQQELEQKLQIAQTQLDNAIEKWNTLIECKEQERDLDLQNKKIAFENLLVEFDGKYSQPPPVRELKLPSTLLDLHAREKYLLKTKRFEEAKEMKSIISDAEKEHFKRRQEIYIKHLNEERRILIYKEEKNDYTRRMIWESTITKMRQQANEEINHAKKTLKHIQDEINGLCSSAREPKKQSPPLKTPRKIPNSAR